jgi:tRNA 2-selenouridine synthase
MASGLLQPVSPKLELDLGTFLNMECPVVSSRAACEQVWSQPESEVLVDVRAPCEYAEGHIHGAINVPLFDDKQRADIGLLYKGEGKSMAIELGKAIIQPRLSSLTAQVLPFKHSARISVCCARGGMRSRSFANFLAFNGFNVQQVEGGYRDYRADLAPRFEAFFQSTPFIGLAGRTGVGKTMLLQALEDRIPSCSVDLEGYAQHRSSMFGGFGKVPRNTTTI